MTPAPAAAGPFSAWERSVAARYLRARRSQGGVAMISVISFTGVMLAVAVLIIVMSVMNGFRAELLTRMLGFNGHLYVQGGVLASPDRDAMVARVRALPGIAQAMPIVEAQAMAIGPAQIGGAIVRGLSPADLKATKIIAGNIKAGSLAGFGQGEYGGDQIVVGERLAQAMGVQVGDVLTLVSPAGGATPFGPTVQRKGYTVAATFAVGMSEYDQAFIYMPLEQAQLFFGKEGMVDVVEIMLDNPDHAAAMKAPVARVAGPAAVVTDWTQKNASYWTALMVERNVMGLILGLLVAIAAMNIISGLIMLVKNKTRDIAILRTMGAGQGAVLRIFFMAGAAIGALGTAAGLIIGVLFCTYIAEIQSFVEWVTGANVFSSDIYYLTRIPAKVDPREVIAIAGFSLFMSFFFTLPTAHRASRIDPVEALRYE